MIEVAYSLALPRSAQPARRYAIAGGVPDPVSLFLPSLLCEELLFDPYFAPPTRSTCQAGVSCYFGGGQALRAKKSATFDGQISLLCVAVPTASGGACIFTPAGNTGTLGQIWINHPSSGTISYATSSGRLDAFAPSLGTVYAIVLTHNGTESELWVNGRRFSSSSLTAPSMSGQMLVGGRDSSGDWPFTGHIALAATFSVALPSGLARSLSLNPWAMFERRVWLPTVAAAAVPTLSAATYVPGSITSAGFRPRVTAT